MTHARDLAERKGLTVRPQDAAGLDADAHGGVAVPRWADNALAPEEAPGLASWAPQPGEPTPQERHDQHVVDFYEAAVELADSWHGVLSERDLCGLFERAVHGHDERRADDDHYAALADAASC